MTNFGLLGADTETGEITGKVADWLADKLVPAKDLPARIETQRVAREGDKLVSARALGALGNNTADNAAFLTAATSAKNGSRTAPTGTSSDPLGTVTIDIPAGDYRITDLKGLLGAEGTASKRKGLRIRGAGSDLTQIIFDPATQGALTFNDYWLNIEIEGITFVTLFAGADFMQSYTTHAAQKYTFRDVIWRGPWRYVFDLQGGNNNSEFSFYACETSQMQAGGAFLYIGATNTSDQFLNYWFFGFKHWSTSAALIDAAKGGHFHIFGLDVSDYGGALTAPGYIFNLRGSTHSHGVQALSVRGMRVEAKSVNSALLYSEWADGNVSIQCDWTSQVNTYTYGDIINIRLGNVSGPIYEFHNSHLAGGVKIGYLVNAFSFQHNILFRNVVWRQKLTPSEVVTFDEANAGSNLTRPKVRFENCRGTTQNASVAAGATVWDALIGHGDMVHAAPKRSIQIKEISKSPTSTDLYVALPVGAIITGLRAFAPAGVVTESNGGEWTLWTTETTPTQIAQVAVTTALNAGFHQVSELPVPYLCNAREKATVKLVTTNVTQGSNNLRVFVEGYW